VDIKILIINGADVSIINAVNNSTPLNHAVYYGQLEILQMLISANRENFNLEMIRVDEFGYTPIYRALERGNQSIVEELIKQYPEALEIKNGKGIAAKDFERPVGTSPKQSL
jgi:ankyrin repeat protein